MPVIVSNKGAANANSYCDISFADALLDQVYGSDGWGEITEDDKARLLISATRMIDELNLEVGPETETQSLCFPLDGMTDPDFDDVKEATVLQALYLMENADSIKEAQSAGILGVRSEGLSGMSRSVTGYNPFKRYSPGAIKLLRYWLDLTFSVGRG